MIRRTGGAISPVNQRLGKNRRDRGGNNDKEKEGGSCPLCLLQVRLKSLEYVKQKW